MHPDRLEPVGHGSFGRRWLADFPLDPNGVYLNHGTVGVAPLDVMRARFAILDEIERHPARFMLRELMQLDASTAATPSTGVLRLRAAATRVAAFLGCSNDGLVFVDNATSGICAVLRSMPLEAGDEVLLPDQSYGGVARAAAFIAAGRGASVRTFRMPFPPTSSDAVVEALEAALTPRTRLALLDHVTSETALVMPLAAMASVCRRAGVAVLVDGAHAPGAIDVDIESLGVDWYVANLHKWAFAPRACGVLWAAANRRAGLHPTVTSWGVSNDDWRAEFEWTGTRDPSPWLAAPAGLDYLRDRIGTDAMRDHNHRLVLESARRATRHWGQPFETPESMIGCMATLPLPERFGPAEPAAAQRVRDQLLFEHAIEIPVLALDDRLWIRLSIQVYNDASDVDRLLEAIDTIA